MQITLLAVAKNPATVAKNAPGTVAKNPQHRPSQKTPQPTHRRKKTPLPTQKTRSPSFWGLGYFQGRSVSFREGTGHRISSFPQHVLRKASSLPRSSSSSSTSSSSSAWTHELKFGYVSSDVYNGIYAYKDTRIYFGYNTYCYFYICNDGKEYNMTHVEWFIGSTQLPWNCIGETKGVISSYTWCKYADVVSKVLTVDLAERKENSRAEAWSNKHAAQALFLELEGSIKFAGNPINVYHLFHEFSGFTLISKKFSRSD